MHINRANYKMMAIIFMAIDHAGALLFGNNLLMRMVGRLAFPMFVYLLYDGYHNTRDLPKYARRMILFWAISIVPYSLAFYDCLISIHQNVFLSLFMYLGIFSVLDNQTLHICWKYIFATICAVFAEVFHMEYGWYGVALAVITFLHKNDIVAATQFIWITCLECIWHMNPRQCTAPAAFLLTPPVFDESRRPPVSFKIFNYVFYPLHLIMLWVLSVLY